MATTATPLTQENRTPCSLPLTDADLGLDNCNWTKGLQAMSDWVWSGNLNPVAFPNNLARYFLQVPGIFEQQLPFSTALIFDEPSFRNGVQVSGFLERPVRELVINLIAQRRHAWYTMTHHAILGTLTARKHGLPEKAFADKLVHLTEHARFPELFTPVEREALKFADAFATNPKKYLDADCDALKQALREDNERRYPSEIHWMARLDAARSAYRAAIAADDLESASESARDTAAATPAEIPPQLADRMVNAQLVELAFLSLQFVALAGVFSALNIPDETFLSDVMMSLLRPDVIDRINELNRFGPTEMPALVPPTVETPIDEILSGLKVEPAPLKGCRVPLDSYETENSRATRDKGLAVGGVQVGVWGWSFGSYFPGGLVYLLMHHPELARFEPPYSLPLLFNEDEWRNGTQTAGFVSRRLKEIVYLKVYTLTRSRYGLEHHTMFLFNVYLDEYGVGRPPNPPLDATQKKAAETRARQHAERVVLYVQQTERAPRGTFTDLELATIAWVQRFVCTPHCAWEVEQRLRDELDAVNHHEVEHGLRRLDRAPGLGDEAAFKRLLDHQIAELAMLTGHMDGLGRAMSILRLESEGATSTKDGYLTNRPSLFEAYKFVGVTDAAATANELRLNPVLLDEVLKSPPESPVSAVKAAKTGEF